MMKTCQDENLIIDYICGALDEPEERSVSQRLINDREFCQFYRQLLQVLRTILGARRNEADNREIRERSTGLAARTIAKLHDIQMQKPEILPRNESLTETLVGNLTETRLGIPRKDKTGERANAEISSR